MFHGVFLFLFWENSITINCFLEDLDDPEKGLFGVSHPDKDLCRLIC